MTDTNTIIKPVVRTTAEISERIRRIGGFLNFEPEVLMDYLPSDALREHLTADPSKAEEIAKFLAERTVSTDPLAEAREYMASFGWDKALGHRGISASRTVQKMRGWMWLIGDDDAVSSTEDDELYTNYGVPILLLLCRKYGWPIPDDPNVALMGSGQRCLECQSGDEGGCG